MSLKEKNKPSKNAWAHWLKSEAISIVMEALKNKAFGGSRGMVNCILTLLHFIKLDIVGDYMLMYYFGETKNS